MKKYIKPSMRIVRLHEREALLTTSIPIGEEPGDEMLTREKRRSTGFGPGLWEDMK
ncbi:MAG: hypothetical protein IJ729_06255 [Alloprevotella sp.]|nr:hypothetical protein [Alloprevotella sp.]